MKTEGSWPHSISVTSRSCGPVSLRHLVSLVIPALLTSAPDHTTGNDQILGVKLGDPATSQFIGTDGRTNFVTCTITPVTGALRCFVKDIGDGGTKPLSWYYCSWSKSVPGNCPPLGCRVPDGIGMALELPGIRADPNKPLQQCSEMPQAYVSCSDGLRG
jgi:hypothetical protein